METCRLCKVNDATKTNSHVITWALIKDCLTKNGYPERGYELTFSLSTLQVPDVHIGRSILPEHIENILAPNYPDSEAFNKKDPLAKDFILCQSCETGIGKIESKFIEKVYNRLGKVSDQNLKKDTKGNKTLLLSTFETKLTMVLSYSIFFRTSIANFHNNKLSPAIQEKIRLLLYTTLLNIDKAMENDFESLSFNLFPFPVLIYYLENNGEGTDQNLVLCHPSKVPYSIWANRMIFQLYEKPSHVKSSIEYFFGLSEIVNSNEYFPLKSLEQIKVCIISNEKRFKMVLKALEFMADQNMKNQKRWFNEICKRLLLRKATELEKNIFAHHYSNLIAGSIQKNSKEPFVKAFAKTFNLKDQ